jgi:hypothetical protein
MIKKMSFLDVYESLVASYRLGFEPPSQTEDPQAFPTSADNMFYFTIVWRQLH